MNITKTGTVFSLAVLAVPPMFVLARSNLAAIQESQPQHQEHQAHSKDSEASLLEQIAELRASVARLEAALDQNHQATSQHSQASSQSHSMGAMSDTSKPMSGMSSMGGMGKMKGMSMQGEGGAMPQMMGMGSMGKGMMMKGMGSMGGQSMQQDASGQMGMQMGMGSGAMKRMHMMGRMKGMGEAEPAAMLSRLPGFPGASHIYHIGASGYFLDHAGHVDLSHEQQKRLAQMQEKSLLEQSSFDRRVDQAEQELWVLTSAGEPDAAAIETKVREITDLTAEQRLSFIRGVGKAAEVLSEEQRRVLVGDLGSTFADSGVESVHNH